MTDKPKLEREFTPEELQEFHNKWVDKTPIEFTPEPPELSKPIKILVVGNGKPIPFLDGSFQGGMALIPDCPTSDHNPFEDRKCIDDEPKLYSIPNHGRISAGGLMAVSAPRLSLTRFDSNIPFVEREKELKTKFIPTENEAPWERKKRAWAGFNKPRVKRGKKGRRRKSASKKSKRANRKNK